jgi:hypothetical protein
MRSANTRTTQEDRILELLPSGGRLECHAPILALHGSNEILESLPSGGSLECDVPTLALHWINRKSTGNYQFIYSDSGR